MTTKLRILLGALLATGVALAPSAAHAKGARSAEVSGPGLEEPIHFDDGATPANELAQAAGLFTALNDTSTGVVQPELPHGERGPRYVATYAYMVGENRDQNIRQEIYPFAAGGALTYTPPGQDLFDERTAGGWYRAGDELRSLLVSAGLPALPLPARSPPPSADVSEASALARSGIVAATVAAGVALLSTTLVVRRRRRPVGSR